MDFCIRVIFSLFLCLLINCRSISVSCDTQTAQKLLPPRVRRDLANKTVTSNVHGSDISNSTLDLAANISVTDKDTHEHNFLSTIQTPESQITSLDQKSENYTHINTGDMKSTEITTLTNDTRESENVDKGLKSRNITVTPTPNSPVIEVIKQTENTENTESLTTKGESIEIISSSNHIGDPGNVDENSHNITMAPIPNSFVADVTKQAIDTENTEPLTIEMKEALTTEMKEALTTEIKEALTTEMKEALTTEMEADEGHFNIESTTIAFSNPTINGSEKHKDTVDIEPIDQLPTEQDAPNIVDELEGNEDILENSTTKANFTESIKYRPTTTTYDKQAALDNTTTKMQVEHGKVGENSHLLTSSVEKSVVKDDYVAGKRTALSSGKDTIANLKDETIESNTTSSIDLFVNNTSDFSTTLTTIYPASKKPEPGVKTTIRDTNTVVSTSDSDLKTSLDNTNKTTEVTSQSVTSNMKSETPYHKPEVTTANISVTKTDVTARINEVTTKKTAEAVTEENDRTTGSKPLAPTTENGRGATDRVDNVVKPESMFGKYGLAMFIAACAVILCLVFVIIYMCIALNKKRKRKEEDFMVGNSVPKLRMLEVRNSSLPGDLKSGKAGYKDDLPTYSLDYEKHVQEKIEEHRKLVQTKSQNPTLPGAEPTPLAGVSSFMIERKPSGASVAKRPSQKSRSGSQSGPTSPSTPTYPEGKPLLDKGDDPVVFNFAKKPGAATAAREAQAARRGSAPNVRNKMKSVTKSKDDYFGVNV